jgi:hypothetical protein
MTTPATDQVSGHIVSVPIGIPPCCLPGSTAHSLPAPGNARGSRATSQNHTDTERTGAR